MVAPESAPLETTPLANAATVVDPGVYQYPWYSGMQPVQVAPTVKLASVLAAL